MPAYPALPGFQLGRAELANRDRVALTHRAYDPRGESEHRLMLHPVRGTPQTAPACQLQVDSPGVADRVCRPCPIGDRDGLDHVVVVDVEVCRRVCPASRVARLALIARR